jgi:ABC-type glycerol-3-phosphate transport system substrate-binding protein
LDYDQELARYNALKAAEEKYNIEITFDSMNMEGTTQSLSNSSMASTPDYDYYFTDLQVAIPAALAGYCAKLEDFVPSDNDLWNDQKVFTPLHINGMPENETYLFMPSQVKHDAFALGYNKTLLESKGLPDPLELWNDGKWNWDAWRDMLIATTDITGVKKTTVYGFGGFWSWFLDGMLMSNGASIASGPTQTLTSSQTIEVLDFINTIYTVDKTAMPWQENWSDNNNFKNGNLAFFIARDWILESVSDNTGFEFGVVPFPVGPSGNKEANKQDSLTGNVFLLPKNAKDPQRVYNALFDTVNWFNFDEELRDGDMTELEDQVKGKENLDTILWMSTPEKASFDIWLAINQGDDAFSLIPLMNGEVTPSQLAEIYKNWFQTILDQAYKK